MSLRSFFLRRKLVSPEAADLMLKMFVEEHDSFAATNPDKMELKLTESQMRKFREKHRLYVQGALLFCFILREQEDIRFQGARKRLESLMLPGRIDDTVMDVAFLKAIDDLRNLLTLEAHSQISWVRRWFSDINIQITNPVKATLFAISWLDLVYHASQALIEIGQTTR